MLIIIYVLIYTFIIYFHQYIDECVTTYSYIFNFSFSLRNMQLHEKLDNVLKRLNLK